MDIGKYEVEADKLRWRCDPARLKFDSTKDLLPLREFIGQDRAIKAIEFGLSMKQHGYNMYVAGLTGTGKVSAVKSYIQKVIKEREKKEGEFKPDDQCYIYNFQDPDRAQIVSLPKGSGKDFATDVENLLKKIKEDLLKAFSSEEYQDKRKGLLEEGQRYQGEIVRELEERARQSGFMLQITTVGPVLVPMADGKPMSREEYLSLTPETKKLIDGKRDELMKLVDESFGKIRDLEKDVTSKLQKTDYDIGEFTVSNLFDDMLKKYGGIKSLDQFIRDLKSYTLNNLELFKTAEETVAPPFTFQPSQMLAGRDPYLPFRINVFVDNSTTVGPPVIIESNPTYGNLFGKIERRFFLGGYLSDHTMLKAGSFHLANSGYLLLNVRDVFTNIGVWETLKRTIKNGELGIEDPFEQFGLIAPQGLKPQPMPVDVKVVLIGDNIFYHMLSAYDEDFWEIFRVKADFDFEINRSEENLEAYGSFISHCCEEHGLKHFDKKAVAKIIEYGVRLAGDQEKLTSRFAKIKEIAMESDYWACNNGDELITAEDVQKALDEKIFRHNLIEEHIRDLIIRGVIMIDIEGQVAGQINGLSVYSLGDISFGKPSRITAKTFLGRGGIINIERESQLSGSIHDKGILILSGYLGWKYAQDKPLSLSASICFEQSYEGVEGDSASSAELYAVLSSISNLPLRQDIAVTGSVNQKGEIQPIGGVNQKIEGFFKVCKAKGLTGTQGVMIPEKNLKNLMLDEEVVEAVKQGKFHIYSISRIDEGMEVLAGIEAGEKREDGTYPEGTMNYLTDARLRDMAEFYKDFYSERAEEKK
ncbi:MAG: AAA family ATPase [Actinobacteria bacterium]|nr:AAA family ATPase [Actinomycetota bacterium]